MRERDDPLNLTGIWHGNYSYPYFQESVSFVATIIESGGHVSGSTHEPHGFRPETLYASLSGRRDGRAVTFIKVCQNGGLEYASPIEYQGSLSEDGTEIEGRWTIPSDWSGKFLMIRSGGRKASVSQERFEKV